jgi:NAD+ diphosphatase
MLARAHPAGLGVPPAGAIAHHLIRAWVDSA